jgi:WhiB family transcriptional regulator, redox-sensing transcriptional regulator
VPTLGAVKPFAPICPETFPSGIDHHDLLEHGRPAWMSDAACREHSDVRFVLDRGESAEPARAVCAGCLVRTECLGYAMEHGEYGIWGGTTDRERDRARRHAA